MKPGLFRYVLAMTVFVHHLTRLSIGNMAVYIFFVLSGYWIAVMWTGRYAKSERPFSTFYLSRSLRLIPTFVLINFLAVLVWMFVLHRGIVEGNPDNLLHSLASNVIIFGYASLATQFLVPAWSLDIEIQFYLLAPLLIPLVLRWPGPALLASGLLAVGAFVVFGNDLITAEGHGSLLSYLLFFTIGMAAALTHWRVPAWLGRLSLGSGLAIILLIIGLAPLRDLLTGGAGPHGALFTYNLILNAALALVFAPFALSTTQHRGGPMDAMFGEMSFVVYLVHWPAVLIVGERYGSLPALERLPYVVAAILLSMVVTYGLWWFFDGPVNRWREIFIDRQLKSRSKFRADHRPGIELR
jgi:peptidoglycan/LPS O-acetylase OafA/YrhL